MGALPPFCCCGSLHSWSHLRVDVDAVSIDNAAVRERTLESQSLDGLGEQFACSAPEQVDAKFGVRGPHTDIWGFAACVLHLATGQQPYL